MDVLNIQKLKYSIGVRDLLDIETLNVHAGKHIGLVGKNGSGKTTLFNILLGEVEADVGQFSINGSIAILPQLKQNDTTKSGGEVSQDYIVKLLNKNPSIILADEPTTNLDASHVQWVEKKLQDFQGTVLVISHDRSLLDNVCNVIWELKDGKITEYPGNYTDYLTQKTIEKKHHQKDYEKYQQDKRALEKAIGQKENQAQKAIKAPKNLTSSEARDASGVNPHTQSIQKGLHQNRKALETRLEKLDVVEKPKEDNVIKMELPNQRSFRHKTIIRAKNLQGEVGDKTLWQNSTFFIKGGDKVGIIGPNGSGKTTLLKQIVNDSEDNLYVSPAMKIGYFAQNLSVLNQSKSILQNVQENAIQNETVSRAILAQLGFFSEDVHKTIQVLSGGEQVKVSLAKLLVGDYNTLILDEPTNYLDVYALEALEELLNEYEGTLLFVSHDRQFVSSVADKILSFEDETLELFDGRYDDFMNRNQSESRDSTAEELMKVELSITDVLAKLGEVQTEEEKAVLEEEFQSLLQQKKALKK